MHAHHAEAIVAAIGGARRGIVPSSHAAHRGVDPAAMDRMRRRGLLIKVGRGVDRLRDHPFGWESQCQAALDLAGRGAVLGARPSARLHTYYRYRNCDDVEVYLRRGRDHRLSVGRATATSWLPESHVTEINGFPALTLGRTFFALCADPDSGLSYRHPVHERNMARVYNDARRRGLTIAEQSSVIVVTAKRGRRGTTLAREIVLKYPPDKPPSTTETEFVFDELLETYDVPQPERQLPISDHTGFIGVVDFAWPAARLVVEIDSRWHDGPIDQLEDEERDARLRAAGWTVKRWRHRDLVADPGAISRTIRRCLAKHTN